MVAVNAKAGTKFAEGFYADYYQVGADGHGAKPALESILARISPSDNHTSPKKEPSFPPKKDIAAVPPPASAPASPIKSHNDRGRRTAERSRRSSAFHFRSAGREAGHSDAEA